MSETYVNFANIPENVITPWMYLDLSDIYDDVLANVTDAENEVSAVVTRIAQLTNVVAKVDLLRPMRVAETNFKNTGLRASLNNAIRELNSHVQTRSGLTLNEYLQETDIKVKSNFANASIALGFPIDTSNIWS